MSDPEVEDITLISAPYRREVLLQNVKFESGMTLLRIRIREGRRFTILDVDAETARTWGEAMTAWAARPTSTPNAGEAGEGGLDNEGSGS